MRTRVKRDVEGSKEGEVVVGRTMRNCKRFKGIVHGNSSEIGGGQPVCKLFSGKRRSEKTNPSKGRENPGGAGGGRRRRKKVTEKVLRD